MNFPYKISVIVPAYNVENYIVDCLESLVNQTIDKSFMEVIIIDDSSTDKTPEICRSYSEKYRFINYFRIPNSGVSAARNYGIKRAHGKYIMYLDSDDYLTKPSVENIVDYFDSVYDNVDLVTYFIQPYSGDKLLPTHARYVNYLTHTAVYDLEENPYIVQTTMNICVKNLGENNFLFNEKMRCQEDQEYINRVLRAKLKLGYCAHACYMYNRSNDNSCVSARFHAFFLFEDSMKYFEELFGYYEDKVPRYFQAVFFHDLRWKLTSKILYPFHYEKKEFKIAMNRIKALLARVDVDVIVNNPSIDKRHVHYWLNLKPNVFPCPYISNTSVDVVAGGKTIDRARRVSLRLIKIEQLDGGRLRIRAVTEMGIFNYLQEAPKFFVVENSQERKRLKLFRSKFSYVQTNIPTNKAYGFDYIVDPDVVSEVAFKCVIDSFTFDVQINFMGTAVFKRKVRQFSYARGEFMISFYNDTLRFTRSTKEEIYNFEKRQIELFNPESTIAKLKNDAIDYRYEHRVWLYSDLNSVLKDNGYYQFINDFEHKDGVERYYVYTKPYKEIEHLFNDEQKQYLVQFGSTKHQMLYLASELIISSFFGREAISPFANENEELNYYDIQHFKIIYMQHGILHASFVNKYSAENGRCDKVVVSSDFEVKNFTKKYAFKDFDLIKTGMPRYEFIDRTAKAKNRVLFAPSWRSYLAKNVTATTYSINMNIFKASDYYRNFEKFLSDKRLHEILENYDIFLDVKMHPIITKYASELFEINSDRINIVRSDVELSDYKAFITDFSSFVFDYAYLCRPIMYYVPDYPQFKSGMNLYHELDLPFEEAFGNLTTDHDAAIDEFEKICKNNFIPERLFEDRMKNFYLPMGSCREDIYKYVTKNMF